MSWTHVRVWVCVSCGRVFPRRPTKGRGGQNAERRHKVYLEDPVPATMFQSFKLGTPSWCEPIEEWEARPL